MSKQQKALSPEQYIRQRARKLPIGDCYLTEGWEDCGELMVWVTRCHPQQTYTVGIYLIDTFCCGVKDSHWYFSLDKSDYADLLKKMEECEDLKKVSYEEVHNLIYGVISFAQEGGIEPDSSFNLTQFLLEEDTEDIPLIEYTFGKDGRHCMFTDNRLELSAYVTKLQKALGDDFLFVLPDMDKPREGREYSGFDFAGLFSNKNDEDDETDTERYSFTYTGYPENLSVKYEWLIPLLSNPDNAFYLSDELIKSILAVPRDELRKDLEQIVLYETGYTCGEIPDECWDSKTDTELLHCIVLLGEVGNEESLSTVLLSLCQNQDYYDFHFGDMAEEAYVPTLYLLGKDHLDKLMEYMKTPGLYSFARIHVVEAVARICRYQPERRLEVIEWFRHLLTFYDGRLETCQCCDGMLIGMLANSLIDMHATELLPEIKKLYDTGLVDEMCCGDFEEVQDEMLHSLSDLSENYPVDIYERYHRLKRWI
jgi:hypothetical protein